MQSLVGLRLIWHDNTPTICLKWHILSLTIQSLRLPLTIDQIDRAIDLLVLPSAYSAYIIHSREVVGRPNYTLSVTNNNPNVNV